MKNPLVVTLIVIILLTAGIYVLMSNKNTVNNIADLSQIQPTQSPVITVNPQLDTLRAGGSSFTDPNGLFTVLYPSDYVLDTSDKLHPRIYKRGPSERPQSEMSDGVLVVFETVELEDKTLEQFVDAHIEASIADETSELVQPKKTTTVNSIPGFSYQVRGLGSSTNIVVQKEVSSKQALLITYLVEDPQSVGYQQEVDAILSTLVLNK